MSSKDKHIYLKAYGLYFLFVLAMIAVIYQVVAIQLKYDDSKTASVSSGNAKKKKERIVKIAAMRGEIKDADGNALVTSVPYYELRMDPTVVKSKLFKDSLSALCKGLASIFPEHDQLSLMTKLQQARNKGNRYLKIEAGVPHDVLEQVKELPIFNMGKNKGGLIAVRTIKRNRSKGVMAARTLGYVRENAQVGIEAAYNDYLAGKDGEIVLTKLGGVWRPISGGVDKDPVDGADVYTTIDSDIQEVAENELMKQLKAQGAKHGSVVVMEVETGYVKAIANLSIGKDSTYYERYNHAIGRATEPGSTFKLASLMALLEDGKVRLTDSVYADGVYKFYDRKLHDSRPGGYGKISVQRAFEVSSNVMAKIVNDKYKQNPQAYIDRIKSFGVAEPLGVSIRGEGEPFIKNQGDKGWSGVSLPWISIGYESKLTPLQTLSLYNAVANNGRMMKPQFVKEVKSNGKVLQYNDPVVLKESICSKRTIKDLQQCLEGVVERGTGKALKSANFKIAGKTGTARIAQGSAGYGNDSEIKYQASFAGYFPADNPKYSCIVVIAAPSKNIYGAKVSGTVFAAIANKVYASNMGFHPDLGQKKKVNSIPDVKTGSTEKTAAVLNDLGFNMERTNSTYATYESKEGRISADKRFIGKKTVPNVIGMGLQDALLVLNQAGLKVNVKGVGKVRVQSLDPGSPAVKGGLIDIELR